LSTTPARDFTRLAVAIVVAAVVISASALSYSSFERTVTTTSTVTFETVNTTSCTTATAQAQIPPAYFKVEVNYSGPWTATVHDSGENGTSPTYLSVSSCYTGTGIAYIGIPDMSVINTQTVDVTAVKLAGDNGSMALSIGSNGYVDHTNSTTAPYGATSVSLSIAP
jgi:hypothetical protein